MKRYQAIAMSIMLAVTLWAGAASAQSNKDACDAAKASSPQKVEGKVVRIDPAAGRLAVTETSAKTHEFQASKGDAPGPEGRGHDRGPASRGSQLLIVRGTAVGSAGGAPPPPGSRPPPGAA